MQTTMKLSLRPVLFTVTTLAVLVPAVAHAQTKDAPPAKDAPAAQAGAKPQDKAFELAVTAASMGAVDSNIFDKGANPTAAAGGELNLGLGIGVPLGDSVSWASGAGVGTNARRGIDGDAGDSNALRLDGHAKTGLELLLFGKTSLPGRAAKKPQLPAMKLGLEAKYAYWSNPLISQPAAQSDATIDALEPTDDASGEDLAEDDGSGAGEQAEAAEIPIGAQTFSNPNTHHKVTGATRLALEISSALSFAAEGGGGRDMVRLTDAVQVSPEYNELTVDLSAKYKVAPKYVWITAGYSFERRMFDDRNAKGDAQDFAVNGARFALDLPFKPIKVKLGYDVRFKSADAGQAGNTTRHQLQIGTEVPITKTFAAVADARYTNTLFNGPPDSTRVIGIAGMKAKW